MHTIHRTTLLHRPSHHILSALAKVHSQPGNQTRREAYRKQEREALPVLSMIAWTTVGSMIDGVLSVNPKRLKELHSHPSQVREDIGDRDRNFGGVHAP